jgi:hypothetical protein
VVLAEMQGWIDTTYMNPEGTFRLARGNKGTLFVCRWMQLLVFFSISLTVAVINSITGVDGLLYNSCVVQAHTTAV